MTQERTPPLADVLAHGGWALLDPRPTAAAHPDTFEMPTAAELAAVRPGHQVRALFAVADLADEVRDGLAPYGPDGRPQLVVEVERMWSTVLSTAASDRRHGAVPAREPADVVPQPAAARRPVLDLPVSHLIATDTRWENDLDQLVGLPGSDLTPEQLVEPVRPEQRPSIHPDQLQVCEANGLRPHRPWLFSRCLLARDLATADGPVVGGRFEPVPDRGDNGWVVWAGYPDLDTAQREAGFDVVVPPGGARPAARGVALPRAPARMGLHPRAGARGVPHRRRRLTVRPGRLAAPGRDRGCLDHRGSVPGEATGRRRARPGRRTPPGRRRP